MNKILFKLIEGKGKFFLGRNWPVWNPEKCHTNLQCESESERSKEQFCGCWNEYNRAINECISEDLKNGEILNPEVVKEELWKNDQRITGPGWSLYNWETKMLKDGDTFDLPEGMGFEGTLVDFDKNGIMVYRGVKLLPEKPVQKEESQKDMWIDVFKLVDTNHTIEYLSDLFTLKRKE